MTKRSLKEKFNREYRQSALRFKKRLKPPYRCPKCCLEEAVWVEVNSFQTTQEINNKPHKILTFTHRVYCQYGCFDMTFNYTSPAKTIIDAFNDCCDKIHAKTTPTLTVK